MWIINMLRRRRKRSGVSWLFSHVSHLLLGFIVHCQYMAEKKGNKVHIGSCKVRDGASPPPSRRPLVPSVSVPLRNAVIRIGAVGLNVARTWAYFYPDGDPLLLTRCLRSLYTLLHAAFLF